LRVWGVWVRLEFVRFIFGLRLECEFACMRNEETGSKNFMDYVPLISGI